MSDVWDKWAKMTERQSNESRGEYIVKLEAHAEHDEDNLAGLEHALVRANLRYTKAEGDLAECQQYQGWTQFVGQRERAELAEAENTELRKQNEILSTTRRLAEAELEQRKQEVHRIRMCYPGGEGEELLSKAEARIAELEAENANFESGARCDRDEIEGLKAERDELQEAFYQKNMEYVTVLGCITSWVNILPHELKTAILEGKKLAGEAGETS